MPDGIRDEPDSAPSMPECQSDHVERLLGELVDSYMYAEECVPAKLTDYLVIGGLHHAGKPELLKKEYGVTHIFSCIHSMGAMCIEEDLRRRDEVAKQSIEAASVQEALEMQRAKPPSNSGDGPFNLLTYYESLGIAYAGVDADDQDGYDMLRRHQNDFFEFCDSALRQNPKACIYVHCAMGVNRSGCLAVAYVLCRTRRTLLALVEDFLKKRGTILTNAGFRRQVIALAWKEKLLGSADNRPD
eukprot:gnl/TRDRNA2_/TRDRNA2_41402_c0_seq1.p1 gnl/TRDRNA2_/TRDRNA2_41402_c0~~gnl/TRDRNA2_/TRDRNA2_41402_c0_seq1.p1  ORF type:complete len:244 (+),score=23.75 gnl/TRDRNA2_/TRDRNA2_41402_c0_seq1:63-794(+)